MEEEEEEGNEDDDEADKYEDSSEEGEETHHTSDKVDVYVATYSDFHNDCLFLAQKKTILILNAENKDRTGAFWLRKFELEFFLS